MREWKGIKTKTVKLPAGELEIHPLAQRRMVKAQLDRLIADFDLDALGVFHAVEQTKRGKTKLYVIDGQTRLGAITHLQLGEWVVTVQVYYPDISDATACKLFRLLNKRSPVSQFDSFMAEVNGGDPVAVGTKLTCEKRNLSVERNKGDGKVCCVHAIKKIFSWDSGKTLGDALDLSAAAWGDDPDGREGLMLLGMATFIQKYGTEIDTLALAKKLGKFPGGPRRLVGAAKERGYLQGSVPSKIAKMIQSVYNSGRRLTTVC